MTDLSRVPLIALSSETKHLISTLLNPPKVISSSNGLLRDWRGLAQVCSIKGELLPAIALDPDPFNQILNIVQKNSQDFTLQNLQSALGEIERWDIVDDSQSYLEKDAESYLERLVKSETTVPENDFLVNADILTQDDQLRIERGEEIQHYDAFLLYADEDISFVREIIENLEIKNNLKLCLKDRDLIAGINFEHEAIMRLISERCNRLIPIISPNFLKSPANEFFLNFAQASSIDKNQERKIIPCIFKNCELPPQIAYSSKMYYKKSAEGFFWDKFVRSVKVVPSHTNTQKVPVSPTRSKVTTNQYGFMFEQETKSEKLVENKAEGKSSSESSKSLQSIKNRLSIPWVKKQKTDLKKVEENMTQESIPDLPELDGLDSLSSLVSNSSTKIKVKKKKFLGNVKKLLVQKD